MQTLGTNEGTFFLYSQHWSTRPNFKRILRVAGCNQGPRRVELAIGHHTFVFFELILQKEKKKGVKLKKQWLWATKRSGNQEFNTRSRLLTYDQFQVQRIFRISDMVKCSKY